MNRGEAIIAGAIGGKVLGLRFCPRLTLVPRSTDGGWTNRRAYGSGGAWTNRWGLSLGGHTLMPQESLESFLPNVLDTKQ